MSPKKMLNLINNVKEDPENTQNKEEEIKVEEIKRNSLRRKSKKKTYSMGNIDILNLQGV
jgi:hypothetical protein